MPTLGPDLPVLRSDTRVAALPAVSDGSGAFARFFLSMTRGALVGDTAEPRATDTDPHDTADNPEAAGARGEPPQGKDSVTPEIALAEDSADTPVVSLYEAPSTPALMPADARFLTPEGNADYQQNLTSDVCAKESGFRAVGPQPVGAGATDGQPALQSLTLKALEGGRVALALDSSGPPAQMVDQARAMPSETPKDFRHPHRVSPGTTESVLQPLFAGTNVAPSRGASSGSQPGSLAPSTTKMHIGDAFHSSAPSPDLAPSAFSSKLVSVATGGGGTASSVPSSIAVFPSTGAQSSERSVLGHPQHAAEPEPSASPSASNASDQAKISPIIFTEAKTAASQSVAMQVLPSVTDDPSAARADLRPLAPAATVTWSAAHTPQSTSNALALRGGDPATPPPVADSFNVAGERILDIDRIDQPAAPSNTTQVGTIGSVSAPPVRAVMSPVADAAIQLKNGQTEIALSPEELGRVSIRMTQTDGGLVVLLTAERDDTQALLRKHASDLAGSLREAGLGEARIDFADKGERQGDRSPDTDRSGAERDTAVGEPDAIAIGTPMPTAGSSDRVDIRM